MRSLPLVPLVWIATLSAVDGVGAQDLPGPVVVVVEVEGDGADDRAAEIRAALREALGADVIPLGDPLGGEDAPLLVVALRAGRVALLVRPAGGDVHRQVLEPSRPPEPAWIASRAATLLRESRESGLTARGLMSWPAVASASLPAAHDELLPWPSDDPPRGRPAPRVENAAGLSTPRPTLPR